MVDKEAGHDFYPPQTLQPFAVVDSLVRLGLADAESIQVTTFDVSARVNEHISGIRREGRVGTRTCPHSAGRRRRLDAADARLLWGVWRTVGRPVPVSVPPGVGRLRLRAISIRPAIAARMSAQDVNITAQYLPLSDAERFDLIIGTNVFVYYDRLEQGMAMVSIARMLRPGGALLSNNALVEVPSAGMRSAGYSRTMYFDRAEDGDVMIWYQAGNK